ncbi:Mycothiol S-conjugate amidase [Lacunisphaera limnophila]|uniref:Mycothiol S-conjugate amidase n=1 Tax=Lacunisphaera limnophila TaxID=1838286 RepID=A0A1D8ASQ4_9BACT|nr:PIG-L family deacetylase [Lacunisphaera limnophila]AOS43928.1 Mycothiol S-conjugate amidase [Lacunisphaera limnophila]
MSAGAPTRPAAHLAALTVGLLALASPAPAEEPGRTPAIVQQLRTFASTGTVLHLAAHPDDENTQLITAMARGRGYRAAYLSITRGDGGQNESGPEFGEKLGLARTQELLAARRHDGGRQFFTRAIDYGYSKSPEEALRIWDHAAALGDVVRVIRQFRPDVIITRFPIPPGSGGHGQHTASAMLAVEAFNLAGDPTAYPEQIAEGLLPWSPKRLGWNSWAGRSTGGLTGPTIEFDIGGADPVTGEPFGTIANQSRGMHKTQGLGIFAARTGGPGPNLQTFLLLAGDPPTTDIMDGVDTTWARFPSGAALIPVIDEIIAQFRPADPAASVPSLLALRSRLDTLPADPLVREKRGDLDRIIQACLGLTVESFLPRAEVVPGEKLALRHEVFITATTPVRWIALRYPLNQSESKVRTTLTPGSVTAHASTQFLPATTLPSHPYWLRDEGTAGMFQVATPSLIGAPENPPVFPVEFIFEIDGKVLVIPDQPVQIVAGAPEAQQRRPLAAIPPVSLGFAHPMELFATGATKQVTVEVTAARAQTAGSLQLEAAGWTIRPSAQSFTLAASGDKVALTFEVTAPAQPGTAQLSASAKIGTVTYGTERFVLSYPHLPVQLLQRPARSQVVALEVQTRGRRVGYLPGAGDSTAESLVQLGYEVVTLSGPDLSPEKLAGFDAVVIGVRAFNDRDDLAANLPGLFAWVEAGGTVIAQYNRPNNLKATALGPYPLSIEGPAPQLRVTDEDAPVTFLAPDHPVLNTPNKITDADFTGWVQERGAYFPSSWDEAKYTAILAMNDPGEAPLKSSLLVAQHGKGWFVYTGLSFFRQLPAGHPGAHRLFANLVSLGR